MAYDKITFNDLFDFSDDSQIEKAQAAIKQLMQVYSGFQKDITRDNTEAAKSTQALSRSLTSLEKKLQAVNVASEEGRKQAAAYAQQVSQDVKAINDLRLGQEKLQKQISDLEAVNRKLQNAYDKLITAKQKAAKAGIAEAGSIKQLQVEHQKLLSTYQQMAPAASKMVNDQQLTRINKLGSIIRQASEAMQQARRGALGVASSYAGLVQENARLLRQLREMPNAFNLVTGAINKNNSAAVELQQRIERNSNSLKRMDAQLGMHQRSVGNYGKAMVGLNNGMQQYALALAGEFAGVMALATATQLAFKSNLELSDSQAGVRKTVGMTKLEVDRLAESFKEMDTRTTLGGLFDIARIGGQFGVAKGEIQEFTKAADMAAVALGDEFKGGIEEVATELYTLRGLFEDTRGMSPADAMLAVGSAINTLGAEGAATGPVIAEFAKRLGQLGERGPDIETALGMGAALQELGFSAEIAAGGYTNAIIQMNVHAPKFAKLLKMTEKEFRAMLKANPNEMLLKLSATINGMENGIDVMRRLGIMSQESIKVVESLGDNMEFVRGRVDSAAKSFKDASSIYNEFTIANNTLAASWEKLKNTIVNSMTSGGIGDALKTVIDGFRRSFDEMAKWLPQNAKAAVKASETAGAYIDMAAALQIAARDFKELSGKQNLTQAESMRLNAAISTLQESLKTSEFYINKETGAWELNEEALGKVIKKRQELATQSTQGLATYIGDAQDDIGTTQAKISEMEMRLSALGKGLTPEQKAMAEDKLNNSMLFGLEKLNGATDQQVRFMKEYAKIYREVEKLKKDDIRLNEDLAKALQTYMDVGGDFSKLNSGTVLDIQMPNDPLHPKKKADPTPDDPAGDDKAKELQKMAEAAAEARHALAKLNAEIEVMKASWALEDVADDFEATKLAIERLAKKEIEAAEEVAREKKRHNNAGRNGIILIERDLAKDLMEIERRKAQAHKKALADKEKREKEAAERRLAMMEKYAAFEKEIADDVNKAMAKGGEDALDKIEKKRQAVADAQREIEQALFDFASELSTAYFEIKQTQLDAQLSHLQYNQQKELETVGDNEAAKAEINERYRKQELKLRQRQAQLAKKEALFQILLSTGIAMTNALANPAGAPFTLILAGIYAAMGAVQAAAVASRPIPQYYKGTKSSAEGVAEIAERGPELLEKDGKFALAEKRQFAYLQKGTKVYTADQTKTILSRANELSAKADGKTLFNSFDAASGAIIMVKSETDKVAERMLQKMDGYTTSVTRAVSRQQQLHVNIDRDGVSMARRSGEQWNQYVNSKYRR